MPGIFASTPSIGTVLTAGAGQTLSVTFTPTDTVDYNPVTATATINVSQAQLTVAADDQSMSYGSSVPALTYTVTGFVNGDDAGVVSGTPGLSTTASTSSHPGSYPITVDVLGLSATNYSFVGQDGNLDHRHGHADDHLGQPRRHHLRHGAARRPARRQHVRAGQLTHIRPRMGTVLSAGAGQTLSVTFTPTDTIDYNAVTTNATINVQKATPVLTWANPADITYGTALSAPPSSTPPRPCRAPSLYTPARAPCSTAGTGQTLSVTFTPTDTIDYNP